MSWIVTVLSKQVEQVTVAHFNCLCFFFQAEDGIRDTDRSRGLGDVYKRQDYKGIACAEARAAESSLHDGTGLHDGSHP